MLLLVTATSAVAEQKSILKISENHFKKNINIDNLNLIKTLTIERKTVYAYVLTDITPGFYNFDLNTPGDMNLIIEGEIEPYAGTWANDIWYIITYPDNYLHKVNPQTGVVTTIGPTNVATSLIVTGMAYDDLSGTMYGIWVDLMPNNSIIYQINLTTGTATEGLTISNHRFIDIACNSTGKFYSPDVVEDKLYLIDPTIPSATLIGPLTINLDYAQGAEFDKDSDILYLAAYTTYGALYTCDTTTGEATLIGAFPSGADVDAFAIPYILGNPPKKPLAPNGPDSGIINVEYTFTSTTTDPEGEKIYYMFDWDDGTYSDWIGPLNSGEEVSTNHIWTTIGDYYVKVKAKDTKDEESDWSLPHEMNIVDNSPPGTPSRPIGPNEGKPDIEYTFSTKASDPDGNQVFYQWDWGDGSYSEWFGPYDSNFETSATHAWPVSGSFEITVKAKDIYDQESVWSDSFKITIPRSKTTFNHPLQSLFSRFQDMFPILERILGLLR
jgi:hypothetical protein